jgi:hypothetical protein
MDVYGLSHQAHDCSFFFPVTVGCNSAMEYGIQPKISFVSDKSEVIFGACSHGQVHLPSGCGVMFS